MTKIRVPIEAGHVLARRRRCVVAGGWALAAGLGAVLAGCGTSPPTRFYELRPDSPPAFGADDAAANDLGPRLGTAQAPEPANPDAIWELAPAVALPAALDRDTLVVASGSAGLEPLAGHRWAAPLRDAVPRLLLHDLQRLRGPGRVWMAPVPAGVEPAQRLRVEVLQLLANADRRTLHLQAQWWWQAAGPAAGPAQRPASASAARPAWVSASTATSAPTPSSASAAAPGAAPRIARATLQLALADTSIDTLAAGHRLLLWRLAQRVAASASAAPPAAAAATAP